MIKLLVFKKYVFEIIMNMADFDYMLSLNVNIRDANQLKRIKSISLPLIIKLTAYINICREKRFKYKKFRLATFLHLYSHSSDGADV